MSTSGIEKLGMTKPISPKQKISSKKGSKNSSGNTGRISDSADISTQGKQLSEIFGTLNDVKNKIASNPGIAGKLHKNFDLTTLGNLFGINSLDIENVLKGITNEISNNASAAVNVHSNINAGEVAKLI